MGVGETFRNWGILYSVRDDAGVLNRTVPKECQLPQKFDRYILNTCEEGEMGALREKVALAFRDRVTKYFWGIYTSRRESQWESIQRKNHIRRYCELDGWFVKGMRHDLPVGKDANLYRVRKADRIRKVIAKHHLEDVAVVPQKYLFFNVQDNRWYVVAEKLKPGFQGKFTPALAEAVAIIAMEATMTDLHFENFFQDEEQRVAFIDTEPIHRTGVKAFRHSLFGKLRLLDIGAIKFAMSIFGTNRFRSMLVDSEAKVRVKAVQWRHMAKHLAFSAAKVAAMALVALSLGFTPVFLATPILQAYLVIKAVYLVFTDLVSFAQLCPSLEKRAGNLLLHEVNRVKFEQQDP